VDGDILIKKQIHEEKPVRMTIGTQHGWSERVGRRGSTDDEALLVIRYNCLYTHHHDVML
jgi:hypothetical protein